MAVEEIAESEEDEDDTVETEDATDESLDAGAALAIAQKREVEVRYRRSFLSRYIQAEPYIQDYYTEIKNLLLSYRGVKARQSWSKESFKCGRVHVAKIDVKGKSLYLYLAIDPEALEGSKYKFTLSKGDCPVLIKIKSERKLKQATELISMLMAELGLVRFDTEWVDYHMPYEDTEALIERGLIKLILPKGETLDENATVVKADLSGIEASHKEEPDAQASYEAVEEVFSEEPVELPTEIDEQPTEEPVELPTEIDEQPAEEPVELLPEIDEQPAEEPVELPTEIDEQPAEEPVELPTEIDEQPEEEPVELPTEIDEQPEEEPVELPTEIDEHPAQEPYEPEAEQEYLEPQDSEEVVQTLDEEISVIKDEQLFEARVDDIIKLSIAGKTTVHYSDFSKGTAYVTRRRRDAELAFAFLGTPGAETACVVAPYTREEYLALPRKKKKSVQSAIKALLKYAATMRILESLRALNSDNERILERIEMLELKLAKERRLLPTASKWVSAVDRITK